jgi:hypothetical protein
MKILYRNVLLVAGIWFVLFPAISYGQSAEAPVYKDGDWWRIKQEITRVGFDVSGPCSEAYAEYVVRIAGGKPNVFGLTSDGETATDCPLIAAKVLGRADLKFPLYVGLSWSERGSRQVPGMRPTSVDYKYEVNAWEKMKTPKGEFEAFKVVKSFLLSQPGGKGIKPRWQIQTYYYAPALKAVVHYRAEDEGFTATTTLVDSNLVQ